jgi:ABC-type phosphate transport system ATPase subunit
MCGTRSDLDVADRGVDAGLRGTVTISIVLIGERRAGELVELGKTDAMFRDPVDKRTEDDITGRFG